MRPGRAADSRFFFAATAAILVLAGCSWRSEPPANPLEPLPVPSPSQSLAPFLGPGPSLSWLEPTGDDGHRLVFSVLEKGAWQPPEEIARSQSMFANWADVPAVVAGSGSSWLAHWLESLGGGTYAYGVRWKEKPNAAAPWTDRGWLHDDDMSESEHGFVSWAASEEQTWAFWLDGRHQASQGAMSLRGGRLGPDGLESWSLDPRVCDCCPTDAAMTAAGPVVVYRDRSDDEVRDIASVIWADGAWSSPIRVYEDDWQIAGCPVNGPAVDAAGSTVVVAWFSAPEGKALVRTAFSTDGGRSYSTPILVDGENPFGRVDVALLDSGEALVLWLARAPEDEESSDSPRALLRLRRISPRGAAGAPLTLAQVTGSRASGVPRILVHRGDILVAWVDDRGTAELRSGRLSLDSLPRAPG